MDQTDEFAGCTMLGDQMSKAHRPSVTMDSYKLTSPRPALGKVSIDQHIFSENEISENSDDDTPNDRIERSFDVDKSESSESIKSDDGKFSSRKYFHKMTTLQMYELAPWEPFEWCDEFDDILSQTHKEVFNTKHPFEPKNVSPEFGKDRFEVKYDWLQAFMDTKQTKVRRFNELTR